VKRLLPQLLLVAIIVTMLAGCAQQTQQAFNLAPPIAGPAQRSSMTKLLGSGKIQHVFIIVQENRTPDNLFNGLPGADTVTFGMNSHGQQVPLQPELLTAPYDLAHSHSAFLTEYANGKLNGFDLDVSHCQRAHRRQCPPKDTRAYAYVPQYEVQPYFDLAETYAFGDRMFETNQGPSFPAHQYLLSGTSTIKKNSRLRASENPLSPQNVWTGGCDAPVGSLVLVIDQYGNENQSMYPCFDRPSLTDLIQAQSLTWHYYQENIGPGLWDAPDAIKHVRYSPQYYTDVVKPPKRVIRDIRYGQLANVVWVTPTLRASDHAGNTDGSGPSWVAAVVNAIGSSQYWNSSAIFVTWDDWGGFYDHVKPTIYNSYELGFRVPLIVISPYAKSHYVSHKQHEFGSILKFVEETFGLGSLGVTDVRADDLSDCFQFSQKARPFTTIRAPLGADYFLRQPDSNENPDDDF
jgi:phospholipase C